MLDGLQRRGCSMSPLAADYDAGAGQAGAARRAPHRVLMRWPWPAGSATQMAAFRLRRSGSGCVDSCTRRRSLCLGLMRWRGKYIPTLQHELISGEISDRSLGLQAPSALSPARKRDVRRSILTLIVST